MQSNTKDNKNATNKKSVINDYNEFIAGYMAACTSISVLYPLNKIIFRQQLYGIDTNVAVKQLHTEGIALLYRGMYKIFNPTHTYPLNYHF
jgi:hypothetical protein